MEYFARVATVDGISAARTPSSAPVRFCTWLVMTPAALCKRLTVAPIVPRSAATDWIALLMVVSAAMESPMLDRSLTDPAVPFNRLLWANVLDVPVAAVAIPLPVTPFVSAVKTTLVGVAAAEAKVFFGVGLP